MWAGFLSGVRAAWDNLRDPLAWEETEFQDTVIMPGVPDPHAAIWASLSHPDRVRLHGLVRGGAQMRFDMSAGPYAGLVAAGLAEHVTWEGGSFGHPRGSVQATVTGVLVVTASGAAHLVRLTA